MRAVSCQAGVTGKGTVTGRQTRSRTNALRLHGTPEREVTVTVSEPVSQMGKLRHSRPNPSAGGLTAGGRARAQTQAACPESAFSVLSGSSETPLSGSGVFATNNKRVFIHARCPAMASVQESAPVLASLLSRAARQAVSKPLPLLDARPESSIDWVGLYWRFFPPRKRPLPAVGFERE